jgi:uncharacterized protein YukE
MTIEGSQSKQLRAKNLSWVLALLSFVHGVILLGHRRFWEAGAGIFIAFMLFWTPRIKPFFQRTNGIARTALFFQLIFLGFVARYANWVWSEIFVVIDVMLITFLQEYLQTPEEAPIDFLKSIKNALQLTVPITAAILIIFQFYPEIKPTSASIPFATTGFGINSELNPGSIESLSESDKKAFVAAFPQGGKLPHPENLYWRGNVLTKNDGLHWRQERLSFTPINEQTRNALFSANSSDIPIEHYVRIPGRFSGFTFALDIPISVKEETDTVTTLQPLWGNAYWKPSNTWKSREIIAYSLENGVEEPPPTKAEREALLAFHDTNLQKLLSEPLLESNAEQTLDKYFGSGKFEYSLSPGSIKNNSVWEFLQVRRRGFCEHYAASAANLLRANAIPARIITGYFGGEWSEWDRTLVVREKHAHAWVEFWSSSRSRWVRYDAVRVLAPERLQEVQQTFSGKAFGKWFAAAFQTVSNITEGAFEVLENSTTTYQDLVPNIDVDLFLTIVFAVPSLLVVVFLIQKFVREHSHPTKQCERLAKEFREHIQSLGVDTNSSLTFRQMATIANKRSACAGKSAQAFVETFERVHYANEPLTRALHKQMRTYLKQMQP